jgi:hypothetical protein
MKEESVKGMFTTPFYANKLCQAILFAAKSYLQILIVFDKETAHICMLQNK